MPGTQMSKALALLEASYPVSVWIQRLSPKSCLSDITDRTARALLANRRTCWRCKIGRDNGYHYAETMEEAIEAAWQHRPASIGDV